jgi:four helix bundle protein
MSFEKLRVYVAARQFSAKVDCILPRIRRRKDSEQLSAAAASIPDNIAEAYGVGRSDPALTQGRKIYHLEMARGSTDEARSQLLRLTETGVLDSRVTIPLMILARTIAKMLTGLIAALKNKSCSS